MSEQKTDKTGSKPLASKSANAAKAPASEKRPAATQMPSDKRAPESERKAPNAPDGKAPAQAGRFASRRVWPD